MEEKFREITALAGEHFDDYLIVVRQQNGMMYRASDTSWGLGAAERFLAETRERDRFELFKMIQREGYEPG